VFDWLAFGITELQQQNKISSWKMLCKLLQKRMLTIHMKAI